MLLSEVQRRAKAILVLPSKKKAENEFKFKIGPWDHL